MDWKKAVNNIRQELWGYIDKNGLKSLIIGASGGVDSAVCCALAAPVCRAHHLPFIVRSLPTVSNRREENQRATLTGNLFGTDFKEVSIDRLQTEINAFLLLEEGNCQDAIEERIRAGNVSARARMIYLYNLAFRHKGLVLSTDNLTEFYLGFFTLHGDHNDYGMIQNLWKTEVYELARYLILMELNGDVAQLMEDCIKAVPTDGLGITNSDLDQIGTKTYEEADQILKIWLCFDENMFNDPTGKYMFPGRPEKYSDFEKLHKTLAQHPVILRYEKTHFKRDWPIIIERKKIFN